MIFGFYSGIIFGHLLSCCFATGPLMSMGTSCGTLGLLPLEITRFIKNRKRDTNFPKERLKYLVLNIGSNVVLNILAIFGLDPVDWISHIGCLFSGVMILLATENYSWTSF